ncbi:Gramicidin S synthase 1 [Streptomyces sp. ADI95-16]|uniref:amino acid adenylation domain-containing protein n=1 Tax=Streptomyces sp. ADI95-16 TaxID=1522758 RepID=UPI000F42E4F1|nr:amino acid adenylation domain-containing protein [Streptomyces sp. ADI95-16]AYV26390.1 Gramicidin S synthase 1 [Streptomyces sp. ADI95-16]
MSHGEAGQEELFRRFGWGSAAEVPYDCVHHAVEVQAAGRPMAVAAEFLGESITYGELDRQADRLASVLEATGVGPGDCVPLFTRRGIPLLVGLLAVLKAGAAYVPQDALAAPAEQLRHIVAATRARVVLTAGEHAHLIPAVEGVALIAVDAVMAEPLSEQQARFVPARPARGDDGCYVLFTSGTTGSPNGVVVTHRNVCNLLFNEPGGLGIGPGQRVAQILNIAFDMAAWEILGALSHGATLIIRGKDIAEAVRRADVVISTPTILSGIDPASCHRVKVVAVAGEPCPRQLADRWAAHCTFYNSCGPTETTIVNTMQRHTPSAGRLTIGRPTPNNTVYILDEQRRPLPVGEVGEMWAGGEGISAGYLGDPVLTAERYVADPFLGGGRLMFRTRDLGRWTADGELEILGRTDDQVKVRGFRVELNAVSAVLEGLPGCVRAATLKLDERTLVSFASPAGLDSAAARQAVADALPYYCVPETVHILPELPRTSRGKIDKEALRRLAERHGAQETVR